MVTSSKRIDVISDTHGHLSDAVRRELVGADLIVHAGDIISYADYRTLLRIAEVKAVLGNNDFDGSYGPAVMRHARFSVDGLVFDVCHFEQCLNTDSADVCVFGHTHRPVLEEREVRATRKEPEWREGREGLEWSGGREKWEEGDGGEEREEQEERGEHSILFVNPGSPTFPRGGNGPTMARLWISNAKIEKAEILELAE